MIIKHYGLYLILLTYKRYKEINQSFRYREIYKNALRKFSNYRTFEIIVKINNQFL